MATLIHCSLVVEANGKALHVDKKAKRVGVEVAAAGRAGPLMQVLGMKREIRLAAQDVLQVSDSKITEGRLAFVAKNNMRIIMTKAQPTQLQMLLQRLRDGSQKGIGLGDSARRVASPAIASIAHQTQGTSSHIGGTQKCAKLSVCQTGPAADSVLSCKVDQKRKEAPSVHRISLADISTEALEQILEFSEFLKDTLAKFAEACVFLGTFAVERQIAFRLDPSCGGIDADTVVARMQKRPRLEELGLAGWVLLTAPKFTKFAQVLQGMPLKTLNLRGCKALTDASIRRVLEACPALEVLNVLEIRLSNSALDVPFRCLRVLAAGTLGRQTVAERPSNGDKFPVHLTIIGAQASVGGGPPQKKSLCSVDYTAALLKRLAQRGEAGAGTPTLTHLVLPNCTEIEVLTRLPHSLRHLDIRGANLQVPEAAVPGWRPLSSCNQLQVLSLAYNKLLSSEALLACVSSLVPGVLSVLDVSGTKADLNLVQHLISCQKTLTHLRLAACPSLGFVVAAQIESWLHGLPQLEVLDLTGCYLDELLDQAAERQAARDNTSPVVPPLRFFGVGQVGTACPSRLLEATRRLLSRIATSAHVIGGSLDIFDGYKELPPHLI